MFIVFFGICGLEKNNPRRLLTQTKGRDQIKGRTKYERTINCRATVKIRNNKMWEKISGVNAVLDDEIMHKASGFDNERFYTYKNKPME